MPLTSPQNKTQSDILDKNIPGWKEHVEPYTGIVLAGWVQAD